MKKILITGAAGGIGSTLSHHLYSNGYNLILVDNLRNGYKENLYSENEILPFFYEIDINSKDFESLIKIKKPNIVIHLAAITSLPDCETNYKECIRINVEGTASVLGLCAKYGVDRVIFASTSAVYENTKLNENGFSERDEVNPKLYYSLSKKMAEELCFTYIKNYGLDVIILRFFNVFGPNQDLYRKSPPVLNYLVREFVNDRQPILHSDGNQSRDYVYVNDVVKIIELVINKKKIEKKLFNVSSNKLTSLKEIVEAVKNELLVDKINETYHSPDQLWDSYNELFSGVYALKKEIVSSETNKTSLGNNDDLIGEFNYKPSSKTIDLIKDVVKQMKFFFKK